MTSSPLRPLGLVGVIAVAGAMLLGSPALAASALPSQAPADETVSLEYVSLGDSYAAGLGQTPLTGQPAEFCGQSSSNFPHQLASNLGLDLTADVSCSNARAANINETAQSDGGTPPTTVPIQTAALSADTDVVTISVGGIDAGFTALAQACLAQTANGPVWGPNPVQPTFSAPNCKSFLVVNGVDTVSAQIVQNAAGNIEEAYAAVRAAAPNAKVIVVGYPAIFPDAANTPANGCFAPVLNGLDAPFANGFPYTDVDVEYLHQVEVTLNQVLAAQAAAAGFTFVDNLTPTLSHSACSEDPYMNRVTIGFSGSLHPNAAGVAFLAGQVSSAVEAAFPAPVPAPEPAPAAVTPKLAETGFNGGTAFLIAGGLIVVAAILFIARAVLTKRRKAGS